VALGRLSADSPIELSRIVAKILAYETMARAGTWLRQLNFVAGVGGFGPLADTVIEGATRKLLTEGIPAEYDISMTYGSWRSPFCPDPRRFHETVVDRFNEGCLFWVYLGHGQRTFLDQVQVPGGAFRILDAGDISKLKPQGTAPIAIFLACYTGAFDEQRDCLAEEMLRSPDGPVAVLAGSRVTMPYAMAVMGDELLKEFFAHRRGTLGELVMHAKRELGADSAEQGESSRLSRRLLDNLAAALSPSREALAAERREHVLLFNLLGDPLLRLRHAQSAVLDVPAEVHAGTPLKVICKTEIGGRGWLELVCRRDRWRIPPPRRAQFDASDTALSAYSETYAAANDHRWSAMELDCEPGSIETVLAVPAEARGPCYVRVMIAGEQQHALGSATVFIRRPLMPEP
jgi:hypothetical protein